MTHQDKAVALAIKHGAVCIMRPHMHKIGEYVVSLENLTAMLTDHAQQVREELAKASGVMPVPWYVGDSRYQVEVCDASKVREAIASQRAKLEEMARVVEFANKTTELALEELEQSEQRVRELEKDAAFATDKLALMFDAYENGTACYEDPDDCSGYLGRAFQLDDTDFNNIADFLNKHRPVNAVMKKENG